MRVLGLCVTRFLTNHDLGRFKVSFFEIMTSFILPERKSFKELISILIFLSCWAGFLRGSSTSNDHISRRHRLYYLHIFLPKRLKVHYYLVTGFVILSINKVVYYQHLLVLFGELLSLRLSDPFALVVGWINNNPLNLWKDACKEFKGISPPFSASHSSMVFRSVKRTTLNLTTR